MLRSSGGLGGGGGDRSSFPQLVCFTGSNSRLRIAQLTGVGLLFLSFGVQQKYRATISSGVRA